MTTSTPQRAGRPCTTCEHPQRQEVERALLNGAPIVRIAAQFQISPDALRRHGRSHAGAAVRDSVTATTLSDPFSLLAAVIETAERAQALADAAMSAGQTKDALRAGDSVVKAAMAIWTRLGVEREDILRQVENTKDIAAALGRVIRDHPHLAEPLAEALETRERGDLAHEIRETAAAALASIEGNKS